MGLEDFNFYYFTDKGRKVDEYRPFYLLIIGKYKDIVHYYEMLKINGLSNFPEKHFIIFSPKLVDRLATFENSDIKPTKIKEVLRILRPGPICRDVKQFVVNNNPSKPPYFDVNINHAFLPYVPVEGNPKDLEIKITAWKLGENPDSEKNTSPKGKKVPRKELINCKEALRAFDIKDIKISAQQLNFRAEIEPKKFPGNGTYCFKIVLYPLSEHYVLPQWVSDWDMDQNLIYHWRQNPDQFQGNTTLNLKNFLGNIWQIIYQKHKPKIVKLYCYIQRE